VTKKEITNLAASIQARLLRESRATGDDYQTVLVAYACERFLVRLAHSAVRDRFVLKGAMLLRTWSSHPYRATRDLDLLRRGEGSVEDIGGDIVKICETAVKDDALDFDVGSMTLEAIFEYRNRMVPCDRRTTTESRKRQGRKENYRFPSFQPGAVLRVREKGGDGSASLPIVRSSSCR
jgi:hypothetical protein